MIDLVLAIIALSSMATGWIRGLSPTVGALLGFTAGLLAGRGALAGLKAVDAAELVEAIGPTGVFAVPFVLGLIGATIGASLGRGLRERMRSVSGKLVDSIGGAISGLVIFCLLVWVTAGWVRTTSLIEPNQWAAESNIVRALDRAAPVPSSQALGALGDALRFNGFPDVFSGQKEQIREVGPPNPEMVEVGKEASESVVKINAQAPACNSASEGTGWVYADHYVATNAHVVAAAQQISVQVTGKGQALPAQVVGFNPKTDVAVLYVPSLKTPAMQRGKDLEVGADSVVVGFPEHGPYTISPSRVRERITAEGKDIYGQNKAVRQVYSLRADVRPGNSGGPLIAADGRVSGMVFAKSQNDDSTGYALTLKEIMPTLKAAEGTRGLVPTGKCTAKN
ncbi:MarP family serine protease [Brevibacterium sp. Marseille-P9724]|uniref:MarP family serine protease n=1 Tax=Brevibacterium sp. Marseille-P9724 TaxID=2614125 RepID=UPI00125F8B03|nr:MarP family serine protease [Brevibacterium sp. Marseille-P9724]